MKINYHFLLIFVLLASPNLIAGKNKKKNTEYLNDACFSERQKTAAQWVQDCELVIEIGGGKNPISKYLKNNQAAIEIDPDLKKWNKTGLVQHIPKNFQDWNWKKEDFINKKYAIVLIGLELNMQKKDGMELVQDSNKTVLEGSATFKKAKKQKKDIVESVDKKITKEKDLDFSNEFVGNQYPVYPFRKMILLENE